MISSSNSTKELLELLQEYEAGIPAENISGHSKYCHCSLNILSLLLFVIDNRDHFRMNSEIYHINTRNKSCLHLPISNLSVYQRGTYYSGIKAYNSLPSQIKELPHNRHNFKHVLKNFLYIQSFYSLDEYFNCKTTYSI